MSTTILPDDQCPACASPLDACSTHGGSAPRPATVTLCAYCGEVLYLDDQMKHRVLPRERLEALDPDFREFLRVGQEVLRELRLPRPARA
jgi:hypothetical protein